MEQQKQIEITERTREQRSLVSQFDQTISKLRQNLKEIQSSGGRSADAVLSKMEQEHKMNKYLATENLPKQVMEAHSKVDDFSRVLHEPAMNDSELHALEMEITNMSEQVALLAEKRMERSKYILL
jgi:intraflagellar transport protein 81